MDLHVRIPMHRAHLAALLHMMQRLDCDEVHIVQHADTPTEVQLMCKNVLLMSLKLIDLAPEL